MRRLWLTLCFLVGVAPAAGKGLPRLQDRRLEVEGALAAELQRTMSRLRLQGFEPPYFVAYVLREYDTVDIQARAGAIVTNDRDRSRQAYADVRVGDYAFDNTAGGADEWTPVDELYDPGAAAPVDDDMAALRGTFWLLSDARYKAALQALHMKRGRRATSVQDEEVASFSHAAVAKHIDPAAPLVLDRTAWAERLRAASAVAKRRQDVLDSEVRLQVVHERRWFVSSEGSRVLTERTLWGLSIQAVARAIDGALLTHGHSFYGKTEAELPDQRGLVAAVERVSAELGRSRTAPVLDPYTGPAILMEEATGVLFHEVVGHRLEAERLSDESEGQTFKGQVGQKVLPSFLGLVDDPTLERYVGKSLNGFYRFDDEGVQAQPVILIDDGVLKTYLSSRKPVADLQKSNGHGRAEGVADPVARMGNLIVRSSKQVTLVQLKQMLIEEVRRQGKPFGLIIHDISGGDTNTGAYGYQAFRGMPRLMTRVDAISGEETVVRGVELVGTPLASINKIVATSDTAGVFNGYCGAESGFVPVSTIAPAVLMSEIELQRTQKTRQKATVLPAPWAE